MLQLVRFQLLRSWLYFKRVSLRLTLIPQSWKKSLGWSALTSWGGGIFYSWYLSNDCTTHNWNKNIVNTKLYNCTSLLIKTHIYKMPVTLLVEVKQELASLVPGWVTVWHVLFSHEWWWYEPSWCVNCRPNLIAEGYAYNVLDVPEEKSKWSKRLPGAVPQPLF